MNDCILTVLILAYNHEQYIRQTLDGVLNQKTSFRFKILITDDASTDRTEAIIREYIDNYPNKIIPVFNSKNIGLNPTLKIAFPLIDTKYTCLLGGDDYWIDEYKIEKEVGYLEAHPDTSYVHTGLKRWIEDKNCWGANVNHWVWKMPKDRSKRLISFLNHDFTDYPCASTCCYRTEILTKCNNTYPQLLDLTIGEGMLLHASMCMYGEKFHYIPDLTTVYRVRSNSLSHNTDIRETLKYKMRYPKRKIIVFNLFNIDEKQYRHVIYKNLDDAFVFSYSNKILDFFHEELMSYEIDDILKNKYLIVTSNAFYSYVYKRYLKIKTLILRLFTCFYH
jgi:glycosyltransferase involved in cell wall biosynthesis